MTETALKCPHCGTHVADQQGMTTHLQLRVVCRAQRDAKVQQAQEHGGLYYTDALSRLFEELCIPSRPLPSCPGYYYYPFYTFECAWQSGFMRPDLHRVPLSGQLSTEQLIGQKEAKERCRKLIVESNNSYRKVKAFTTLYIVRRVQLARRYQQNVGVTEVGIDVILENHEL